MNPIFPTLLFLSACTVSKSDSAEDTLDTEVFQSGNFQFTNQTVADQCLDGAFSILFLPEGDGTENDWQHPVELPALSALPSTYSIQLQEPFSTMDVTVSAGDSSDFSIGDALQEGVLFNADAYADCLVDMAITAEISIIDNDTVNGQATLTVNNFAGDTCPVFSSDPCSILLDFYGNRL